MRGTFRTSTAVGSVGVFMNVSINSIRGPPMLAVTVFHVLAAFHLLLTRTLSSGYYYPHFTDKENVLGEVKPFSQVHPVSKEHSQ